MVRIDSKNTPTPFAEPPQTANSKDFIDLNLFQRIISLLYSLRAGILGVYYPEMKANSNTWYREFLDGRRKVTHHIPKSDSFPTGVKKVDEAAQPNLDYDGATRLEINSSANTRTSTINPDFGTIIEEFRRILAKLPSEQSLLEKSEIDRLPNSVSDPNFRKSWGSFLTTFSRRIQCWPQANDTSDKTIKIRGEINSLLGLTFNHFYSIKDIQTAQCVIEEIKDKDIRDRCLSALGEFCITNRSIDGIGVNLEYCVLENIVYRLINENKLDEAAFFAKMQYFGCQFKEDLIDAYCLTSRFAEAREAIKEINVYDDFEKYLCQSITKLIKEKDWKKAEKAIAQLTALNQRREFLFAIAEANYREGNFEKVRNLAEHPDLNRSYLPDSFLDALINGEHPDFAYLYLTKSGTWSSSNGKSLEIANACLNKEKLDVAREIALKLTDHNDNQFYISLVETLLEKEQFDGLIDVFFKTQVRRGELFEKLVLIYLKLERLEDLEKIRQYSGRLSRDSEEKLKNIYSNKFKEYLNAGKLEKAKENLDNLTKMNYNTAPHELNVKYFSALLKYKKFDEAEEIVKKNLGWGFEFASSVLEIGDVVRAEKYSRHISGSVQISEKIADKIIDILLTRNPGNESEEYLKSLGELSSETSEILVKKLILEELFPYADLCSKNVRLNYENNEIFMSLTAYLLKTSNYKKALSYFKKITTSDKHEFGERIVKAFLENANMAQAEAFYGVIASEWRSHSICNLIAEAYLALETPNLDQAFELIKQRLNISKHMHDKIFEELGKAYFNRNNLEKVDEVLSLECGYYARLHIYQHMISQYLIRGNFKAAEDRTDQLEISLAHDDLCKHAMNFYGQITYAYLANPTSGNEGPTPGNLENAIRVCLKMNPDTNQDLHLRIVDILIHDSSNLETTLVTAETIGDYASIIQSPAGISTKNLIYKGITEAYFSLRSPDLLNASRVANKIDHEPTKIALLALIQNPRNIQEQL